MCVYLKHENLTGFPQGGKLGPQIYYIFIYHLLTETKNS